MNTEIITCPIEQNKAMPDAKETYGFINTRSMIDVFSSHGWTVESTQSNKTRIATKEGFQKHMVWLSNPAYPTIEGLSKNNETKPRLCLVNAHDMTSRLHIFLGGLRVACLNQILAGNVFRYFGLTHSKNALQRLDEGVRYMSEGVPELILQLKALQSIQMNETQRLEYARRLVDKRLENVKTISVDYSVMERPMRAEDNEQDAYTVMNRVQERVVRGGIPYTYARNILDENGNVIGSKEVSTHTRKLASVSSQISLNQALVQEIYNVAA